VGGVLCAFVSAVLFGAATPSSKALLADLSPFQLAGLLYLGAALGVLPAVLWRRGDRPQLDTPNRRRLSGAILFGGFAGPVLLLFGLRSAAAGSVSLLLNFEVAATAVLGALFFSETLGTRGWLGMAGVIVAGTVLSWPGGWPGAVSSMLVAAACVCWGLDNNLTSLIDGMSASETTLWKAGVAGTTNLLIGLVVNPIHAPATTIVAALAVGALSYGVSIALYITAAHQQGAIRVQSVFAAAPFVGAALSWAVLHEPLEGVQIVAGGLFVAGVVMLASDAHSHPHVHQPLRHVHSHSHDDDHHWHGHPGLPPTARHTHWHEHPATEHTHRHVADLHHRHGR
jgi:drug/metabolite transporter (DMT)-like permease